MAALLAIVAVLMSGRGVLRFLTLPAAVILVFVFDVLGRTFLRDLVGVVPAGPLALGAVLVYLGPALAFVLAKERP